MRLIFRREVDNVRVQLLASQRVTESQKFELDETKTKLQEKVNQIAKNEEVCVCDHPIVTLTLTFLYLF